jgi:hypothetical protein
MASYPQTPVAFPTRLAGAPCDPAHWNLMTDEVAAWEAALMADSSQTQAPMRPRGFATAVEWGHGTAGYGNVLGHGLGNAGAVYLLCEPGTTPGTIKTRGYKGIALYVDANGAFGLGVTNTASADNVAPVFPLTVLQNGCVSFPYQTRVGLQKTDSQAVPVNAWTDLTWNVDLMDNWAFHAAGSANIVVPAGLGGTYLITAKLAMTGGAGLFQGVAINRVSGSAPTGRLSQVLHQTLVAGLGSAGAQHIETIQTLVAGDVLTVQAWNGATAADTTQNFTFVELTKLLN